jgi:hypothetical protein
MNDQRTSKLRGFGPAAKFYEKIGIDIARPGVQVDSLEEIHERGHLFVHAGGVADEQYCKKCPALCATVGRTLSVAEGYLLGAMRQFENSARLIAEQLEAKFPESPWIYTKGIGTCEFVFWKSGQRRTTGVRHPAV